jgi:DNA-binding LacI/PurR family transcriptional regulator
MSAKKTATIQDVADRAKVSISTVSHVVNKTRHVEDATRKRIISAIEELEYRPNQLARGLRGASSKTIGLIISDIREDFFAGITKAIESAANERGYMVILCDSEEDPDKESRYLEILSDRGVDGIILAPADRGFPPRLHRGRRLPLVQVDRRCPGADVDYFGIDNAKYAGAAVRHLASLGRKRLGFVGRETSIITMSERAGGYAAALRDLGLEGGTEVLTLRSGGGDSKGKVKRWIASSPGLDGIICGNANICFTVLDALESLGIAVPEAVGIVSFDDPACFRFMKSPITAIRQPTERLGLAALDALLARAGSVKAAPAREVILPAKLIVRESCGAGRARR